jgi:hypothetical protein
MKLDSDRAPFTANTAGDLAAAASEKWYRAKQVVSGDIGAYGTNAKPGDPGLVDVAKAIPEVQDAVKLAALLEKAVADWRNDKNKAFYNMVTMYYVVMAFRTSESDRVRFADQFWTFIACKAQSMDLLVFNVTIWSWARAICWSMFPKLWGAIPLRPADASLVYPAALGQANSTTGPKDPFRFLPPVIYEVSTREGDKLFTESDYAKLKGTIPCPVFGDAPAEPPAAPLSDVVKSMVVETTNYTAYAIAAAAAVGLGAFLWFRRGGKRKSGRALARRRK